MPEFCLLPPPKPACAALKVDKNCDKCLNFVYRCQLSALSTQSVGILASPRIPPISNLHRQRFIRLKRKHPPTQRTKKRPDPVAALPINLHHFTLAAILTSVSIFFPFNVYKTLPLFHVSTFSLAVASSCPPPFVLGAGR
jgi:hypothetical protein